MPQNNGYPAAYVAYLVEFHATRDYFECHELLEEYWKEHPGDSLADAWVGLIQLAVGAYHYRRGNKNGAVKMLQQSLSRLTAERLETLGLEGLECRSAIEHMLCALEKGAPFADIELPVIDGELRAACEEHCRKLDVQWGAPSGTGDALIHRHTLRDRSGVISERAAAAEAKRLR